MSAPPFTIADCFAPPIRTLPDAQNGSLSSKLSSKHDRTRPLGKHHTDKALELLKKPNAEKYTEGSDKPPCAPNQRERKTQSRRAKVFTICEDETATPAKHVGEPQSNHRGLGTKATGQRTDSTAPAESGERSDEQTGIVLGPHTSTSNSTSTSTSLAVTASQTVGLQTVTRDLDLTDAEAARYAFPAGPYLPPMDKPLLFTMNMTLSLFASSNTSTDLVAGWLVRPMDEILVERISLFPAEYGPAAAFWAAWYVKLVRGWQYLDGLNYGLAAKIAAAKPRSADVVELEDWEEKEEKENKQKETPAKRKFEEVDYEFWNEKLDAEELQGQHAPKRTKLVLTSDNGENQTITWHEPLTLKRCCEDEDNAEHNPKRIRYTFEVSTSQPLETLGRVHADNTDTTPEPLFAGPQLYRPEFLRRPANGPAWTRDDLSPNIDGGDNLDSYNSENKLKVIDAYCDALQELDKRLWSCVLPNGEPLPLGLQKPGPKDQGWNLQAEQEARELEGSAWSWMAKDKTWSGVVKDLYAMQEKGVRTLSEWKNEKKEGRRYFQTIMMDASQSASMVEADLLDI